MGKGEVALEPNYGPGDLRNFAKIIGIPEFTAEHEDQLQRAAWAFEILHDTDEMRASRRDRREVLERIRKAASELKEALDNYAFMFIDKRIKLPFSDTGLLEDLAQAANNVASLVPRSAANPKTARRVFVRDLGLIFKGATGKRPTLRRDRYGKPYGPFFEFVEAALSRLDRYAAQGVENDVKVVVARMAKLNA